MKIIQTDKNSIIIKTQLGKINIKDNLYNCKMGQAVYISIIPYYTVEVKGSKIIVLHKNKNELRDKLGYKLGDDLNEFKK